MSLDTEIREAERAGEILRLARLLIRAGFVKKEGDDCPHCGLPRVGYGIWNDNMSPEQWGELNRIGLPYQCRWDLDDYSTDKHNKMTGCGGIYVIQWGIYDT